MKRSISLRTQLLVTMALLVLLQSLSLVFALSVARVYSLLDAEAFRLFGSTASSRSQTYNNAIGELVGNVSAETKRLNTRLQQALQQNHLAGDTLYLDDAAYGEAVTAITDSLLVMLRGNTVTGAFAIIEGSNAHKDRADLHSAIHIRDSAPGTFSEDNDNYELVVGPTTLFQAYGITSSVNWRLDMALPEGEGSGFYYQPQTAAQDAPRAELERYGYWASPLDILGDGQNVICYTMPLLAADGTPYGVAGVEISLPVLNQYYLPNTDLPYTNSFYAIVPVRDDVLNLSWLIPSGPLAQVYLPSGGELPLHPVADAAVYTTTLDRLGEMYCSVQPLVMYSRNSPFYSDTWSLVGFVPTTALHQSSSEVRTVLNTSILATTLLAFVVLTVLVLFITRKIRGLSRYVQSLSPTMNLHFKHTGIREIDELTSAVERLNQSVVNASKTTSKILELTLLPIGGYEISSDNDTVVLTEHVYTLLGIAPGAQVTKEQWQGIHHRLISQPAPGYEDIYQFDTENGQTRWLRIMQTDTDTGTVGVILDVSKDIEEHRRLAHELDYDALTRLYNRVAFKREAYQLIQDAPEKIGIMLFSDLDNLKYINDTFGHDMGDRLIIRAGEMFRQFERIGGVVSRISGDEFAVYLHGFATREDAREALARQMQQSADYRLSTPDGQEQKIRFSSGVAFYPDDADNVTDLLKLSDFAMYEAKHNQKGALFEFNRKSYQQNAYLLENREAINRLLDEKLIRFAFQPIVDVRNGTIFAYEALMRPLQDNFKSPLEILAVAAAQSKLGQLERVVVLTAFQTYCERMGEFGSARIFINSIPSQNLTDEDYLQLESSYSHIFDRIVVEITEAENEYPENLKRKLGFIHRNNMMVAIDDFGSGYSNEVRILEMMPDIVKIDIALISNIDTDTAKQQLVSNMVNFCHPRGIRLVAEGVERREELAKLIELDMDFVQGFYLARPAFDLNPLPDKAKKEILYLQSGRPASNPPPLPG